MTLVGFPPVSDAGLIRLGELNPGWHFERDDEGATEVTPTSWQSGSSSAEALGQLRSWSIAGPGGRVMDSSTGFKMSTNAVRCPDASWVQQSRVDAALTSHANDFFPGAPDIAIEIASPSDVWSNLTAKIEMYIREGSRYAVAVDPRSGRCFELGTPPFGFRIDIEAIVKAAN